MASIPVSTYISGALDVRPMFPSDNEGDSGRADSMKLCEESLCSPSVFEIVANASHLRFTQLRHRMGRAFWLVQAWTLASMIRIGKRALVAPSVVINARAQEFSRNSYFPRPLGNGQRFAIPRQESVLARVVVLLFQRFPSAIRKFVVAVVVDAPKAVTGRWAKTHVANEGGEGLSPAFAHRDSATAVIAVSGRVFVEASLFSILPGDPCSRLRMAVCFHG